MANPQKENGYTAIANEILEILINSGLNGTEIACVLLVIRKTYGYNKKQDQISVSQFEKHIPSSKRAIQNALKVLQLVQILTLVKKGNSKISSNVWAFNKNYTEWQLVKKNALVQKITSTSAKNYQQLVQKTAPTKDSITKDILQKKKIYKKNLNTSLVVCDEKEKRKSSAKKKKVLEDFDEFWKAYPRKTAKGGARKAFVKALKKTTVDVLISAVEEQKYQEEWTKDDGKYIPHPATWLNNERWEDEVTGVRKPKKEIEDIDYMSIELPIINP